LSVTGVSTFADAITAEEITLQDGKKLNFGNSEDLAIYHDNSLGSQNDSNGDSICNSFASIIKEDGPGGLIFKSNGGDGPGAFQFFDDTWRPILKLHSGTNSRVILFHKAKERLATNSDGISISGSGTETLLDVTATGSVSRLRVGVGVGNSTAVFKFSNKNLDIFNNDTGNVTTYLHKGGVGVSTGSFDWVYGQTNAQLMTLTYGGSLGLGVDAPVNTLHVVGTSTVTSNAWVGGNLGVGGTITGTINYPDVITGTNLNNTSGLSTFFNIRASKIGINISSPRVELDVFSGKGIFQGVGIGTTNPIAVLDVKGIASFEKVGIGTTAMHQITGTNCGDFQVHNSKITCWDQAITVATSSMGSRIGVGTISPRCAVDFSDAGTGAIGAAAGFMMIPRVSSTVRDNFQVSAAPGSVIYNTTTNKMQCHNGSGWQDLF
jgi:hypothetical protein